MVFTEITAPEVRPYSAGALVVMSAELVDTIRRGQRGRCSGRGDDRRNTIQQHFRVQVRLPLIESCEVDGLIASAAMHYAWDERQQVLRGTLLPREDSGLPVER